MVGTLSNNLPVVKIKNRSGKRSHKHDLIRVRTIRTFPFSSDSTYDLHRLRSAYDLVKTRLLELEAEAEGETHSERAFPCSVTLCNAFLVLPPLHVTPMTHFTFDHK